MEIFDTTNLNRCVERKEHMVAGLGHANCAAGITGLTKALLCLEHETLVRGDLQPAGARSRVYCYAGPRSCFQRTSCTSSPLP